MNFDPEAIKKISEMDKEEFAKKLEELSRLLGIDPRLLKNAVGSPEALQKKLSAMEENELRRGIKTLDADTLEKINRVMGG